MKRRWTWCEGVCCCNHSTLSKTVNFGISISTWPLLCRIGLLRNNSADERRRTVFHSRLLRIAGVKSKRSPNDTGQYQYDQMALEALH